MALLSSLSALRRSGQLILSQGALAYIDLSSWSFTQLPSWSSLLGYIYAKGKHYTGFDSAVSFPPSVDSGPADNSHGPWESLWESFSGSLSFSLCHQKNIVRLLGWFTASHTKWSMNKNHLLLITDADKCPCSWTPVVNGWVLVSEFPPAQNRGLCP